MSFDSTGVFHSSTVSPSQRMQQDRWSHQQDLSQIHRVALSAQAAIKMHPSVNRIASSAQVAIDMHLPVDQEFRRHRSNAYELLNDLVPCRYKKHGR